MFQSINDYMQKSKSERQKHLDLNENCINIGGKDSKEYRGLLAHYLKTEIPSDKKIVLAHACNNHSCSNVKHLYWATYSENYWDARIHGTQKTAWEWAIMKYGLNEAKKINRKNASKGGKIGGKKTAEIMSLSEDELKIWRETFLKSEIDKFGWLARVQKEMGCSHTWVRKVANRYFSDLKFYKRNIPT